MSVVGYALEDPNSPRATELSLDKQTYERSFKVLTNSYDDGGNIVVDAVGIPRIWTTYSFGNEYNIVARCKRYKGVERLAPNSLWWKVTAVYETPAPGKLEQENEQANPLLEMPSIGISFETFQEIAYESYDEEGNGSPVRNSAGEVFDPPPMKDGSRIVLTITRAEDINTPHPDLAILYQDKLNTDVFWGCEPGTVKCQGITCQRVSKQLQGTGQAFLYLSTTYSFHMKDSWQLKLLDQGTYYKDSATGTIRKFKTSEGHPYVGLLDGAGHALAPDADPVFLPAISLYGYAPFSVLNLPQSFNSVVGGALIPGG